MRNFNRKFLTTAYKSIIIRFLMDEVPLQRRIYFLTFIESLEMIFSHYTETCEVLLDYPKIGRDGVIEDDAKKAIRTICMQTLMYAAEYEYYTEMTKSLIKANIECGKLCNEKIRQAVIDLRAELNG